MNKKTIIVGILVIVILAAGAGFWVWQKNEVKNQEQAKIEQNKQEEANKKAEKADEDEIDMSDWKTYRSEGWGYSIKYPANLYIKDNPQGDKFPGDKSTPYDGGQTLIISDKEKMGIQDVMSDEGVHIVVSTFKLDSTRNKDQTWRQYLGSINNDMRKGRINGYDFYEIVPKFGEDNLAIRQAILVVKNNWIYYLHGINYIDKSVDNQNIKLMKEIISTFRFTNQNNQ